MRLCLKYGTERWKRSCQWSMYSRKRFYGDVVRQPLLAMYKMKQLTLRKRRECSYPEGGTIREREGKSGEKATLALILLQPQLFSFAQILSQGTSEDACLLFCLELVWMNVCPLKPQNTEQDVFNITSKSELTSQLGTLFRSFHFTGMLLWGSVHTEV